MDEIMPRRMKDGAQMIARIKVIGVGGGGCNAVRRMMQQWQTPGVEYIVVNTDIKSLELLSDAHHIQNIQIGGHLTRGFGAGGDIRIGELAAEECRVTLQRAIKGAELIFITAGMGGGTGTGSAPVVAGIASESGALTIAVVTTPFSFEGSKRAETALSGLHSLMKKVNSVIIVPNDHLLHLGDHDVPVQEAFLAADGVIAEGILAISELVNVPGEINVDLADVKRVLSIPGIALMTTGWAEDGGGAEKAAEEVIFDPFLQTHVKGAKGILFNFSGGPDLTIGEVDRAARLISKQVDPRALIFFGMNLPKKGLKGKVKLTLVATGIKSPLYSNWRSEAGEGLRSVYRKFL